MHGNGNYMACHGFTTDMPLIAIASHHTVMCNAAGKIHWKNTRDQLQLVGPKSLGVALLTAGFVGMVFTIQVSTAHASHVTLHIGVCAVRSAAERAHAVVIQHIIWIADTRPCLWR